MTPAGGEGGSCAETSDTSIPGGAGTGLGARGAKLPRSETRGQRALLGRVGGSSAGGSWSTEPRRALKNARFSFELQSPGNDRVDVT